MIKGEITNMPGPYDDQMMGAAGGGMPMGAGMGPGGPPPTQPGGMPMGQMPQQQAAQSPLAHIDRPTLEALTMNLIQEVEQLRMMVTQQQQPAPQAGMGMPPGQGMMGMQPGGVQGQIPPGMMR